MALILMQQFDSYNKSEVISKAQAWGQFFAKSLTHPVLLLSLSYAPSSVCYNFHNFFRKTSRHLLTRIASATVTCAQYTTFPIYGIIIWKGKGPQTSLEAVCLHIQLLPQREQKILRLSLWSDQWYTQHYPED